MPRKSKTNKTVKRGVTKKEKPVEVSKIFVTAATQTLPSSNVVKGKKGVKAPRKNKKKVTKSKALVNTGTQTVISMNDFGKTKQKKSCVSVVNAETQTKTQPFVDVGTQSPGASNEMPSQIENVTSSMDMAREIEEPESPISQSFEVNLVFDSLLTDTTQNTTSSTLETPAGSVALEQPSGSNAFPSQSRAHEANTLNLEPIEIIDLATDSNDSSDDESDLDNVCIAPDEAFNLDLTTDEIKRYLA